jgi:lipopolysaccharide transport system ATP-binding protein
MSNVAISIRCLSKKYRLGSGGRKYRTLREDLVAAWRRLTVAGISAQPKNQDWLWALKDVTFDVQQGEVVGIIGRNGAGKSTLLKIITGITTPTDGRIELRGRVGSLLEVGTGFHGELTGLENIYLNGAILGMRRSEIRARLDEIVAFSEVEKFLDTPVKHYSSGMHMRLAFAVAAHLDPEVLLVDEVLAVGDVAFQRKCLGKMGEVARSGRTILFVSHNLAAVSSICQRAIQLEHGVTVAAGPVKQVVEQYLHGAEEHIKDPQVSSRYVDKMEFLRMGEGVGRRATIKMGEGFSVHVDFRIPVPDRQPVLGLVLRRGVTGEPVFGVNTKMTGDLIFDKPVSRVDMQLNLKELPLVSGEYLLDIYLGTLEKNFEVLTSAMLLDVAETDVFGTGKSPYPHTGPVFVKPEFRLLQRL